MTAPDPGLTDLIAAEVEYRLRTIASRYRCAEKWSRKVDPSEIENHISEATDRLMTLVEQHTNGRIAELDWDELVTAIPDGWELRESAQLEEVSRVRQRDLEASQATTARWRARAEKAEATIARVEKALEGVCDSCDYTDLRTVLEGES